MVGGIRSALFLGFVLGGFVMLTSCSEKTDCRYTDAVAISGLSVTVRSGGELVCDATVTATDGSYSETLRRGSDCTYTGAVERPGTYVVTATAGAETAMVTGVRVGGDPCHVHVEDVSITLTP
jgi:hypothetical protein